VVFFYQVYSPKPCMYLSCTAYMPHAPIISFFMIRSLEYYLVSSADHKDPHYVVFLHSPVTLSLLGPNIILNTLFSNTITLHSFLSVREHVSHPYKIIRKIIVLYTFTFTFLDTKLEGNRFGTKL
jgi:hypothetical protein